MPILTGKRIKEVYVLNRKLVPENIDLDDEKIYTVDIENNSISILFYNDIIYYCKFKIEKKD